MIEWAECLAAAVNEQWRKLEFRHEDFTQIAKGVLSAALQREQWLIADWTWLWKSTLPRKQLDVAGSFADPQITLFEDSRIVINANLWRARPTAIHDHGFYSVGAQLRGASLLADFAIRQDELTPIAGGLFKCDLSLRQISMLSPGDMLNVPAGRGLVHQVFHLDPASIFLEVRTRNPGGIRQHSYVGRHLAVASLEPSLSREIQIRAFETVLEDPDPKSYLSFVDYLSSLPANEAFAALSALLATGAHKAVESAISDVPSLRPQAVDLASAFRDERDSGVAWSRIPRRELRVAAAMLLACRDIEELRDFVGRLRLVDFRNGVAQLLKMRCLGLRPALLGMEALQTLDEGAVPLAQG